MQVFFRWLVMNNIKIYQWISWFRMNNHEWWWFGWNKSSESCFILLIGNNVNFRCKYQVEKIKKDENSYSDYHVWGLTAEEKLKSMLPLELMFLETIKSTISFVSFVFAFQLINLGNTNHLRKIILTNESSQRITFRIFPSFII